MEGFFQIYNYFYQLSIEFPEIIETINNRINKFIKRPQNRHKRMTPNLGNLISMLLLTNKYKWSHISKVYLEESRYYVEEIRKNTIKQLGYDKVYKEGLNIKTPLNLELQKLATISLREGIEKYDRRKGWRGPIQNINLSIKDWPSKIKLKKLEKTLNWKIARVTKIGISNF